MPTPINGQRENWQGRGYKRYDAGRGWVYYIRKKHHGKQYEKSTGVMGLSGARPGPSMRLSSSSSWSGSVRPNLRVARATPRSTSGNANRR